MPAPFGITATGFSRKTLEEVLADLKEALKANVSANLNLSASSPHGQIVGIFGERLSVLWDLAAAVYDSQYPDSATGFSLVQVCAITGTMQDQATRSRVTGTVNLDAATTLPAGSVVAVDGNPTARFRTIADVTSIGAGNYQVEMEAEETGPVVANSGTLTDIKTPVTGWNSATNALDATLGSDIESDTSLRLKREAELRAAGTSPVDAIRSDLLDVAGVTQARVFENITHLPDADGVPGHSIECVVLGGTDPAVAQAIWDAKAAGIGTYGTTTETVQDDAGGDQDVSFTRPTEIETWVLITVLTDPDLFPVDGEDQIKAAVVALGDLSEIGEDVVRTRYYAPILSVTGVIDVTVLKVDDVDPPVAPGNLTIGSREIAVFDTSRVDVTVT